MRRRVKTISRPAQYWAGLISCLLLFAGIVLAQDEAVSGQFGGDSGANYLKVKLWDNLVTLSARDVRLRDILAEIARQSDLNIVSRAPLDARLTLELERRPLFEVLVRLMRDQSYMLHQASASVGDTLWVFSDGSTDDTAYNMSATSIAICRSKRRLDRSRVFLSLLNPFLIQRRTQLMSSTFRFFKTDRLQAVLGKVNFIDVPSKVKG